jgi:GTP-binding protein LepA
MLTRHLFALFCSASQGIQAQTSTVYDKAKSMTHNQPELLLALTKVDLENARPVNVALAVSEWLDWEDPDDIILTSARSRVGIAQVLDRICRRIPSPPVLGDDEADDNNEQSQQHDAILRAQVVDSWYDDRGVNCLVQIRSGQLAEGDRIVILNTKQDDVTGLTQNNNQQSFSVQEIGLVLPHAKRTGLLRRGQMGYVRFGLRDPRQAQPGTLLILQKHLGKDMVLPPIPASRDTTKSVLYASVHPSETDGFDELCSAVDRLALNDVGLDVARTASLSGGSEGGGPFLGPGLRVGFQGILHMEVFRQRLQDEFDVEAIITPPKVPYRITFKEGTKGNPQQRRTEIVEDLADWPGAGVRYTIEEPMVSVRIIAPMTSAGSVMELISRRRGVEQQSKPVDEETWIFTAQMPWAEVVVDFNDQLKTVTAGYGSLDTSEGDPPFREANVNKVDIMLNGDVVEPLAFVCHKNDAQAQTRVVCKKLQQVLPRQQFVTVIQAKADGRYVRTMSTRCRWHAPAHPMHIVFSFRIIASERIKAFRKDVLVKSGKVVGGGDQSRKKKLLEKQKKGKKRQQADGKVTLSQAAFNSVISRT